jgi:2-polyprenyl-6-methoxyphenol hydroxylase-like FAD-dependent oxidoreductase
MHGHGSSALVLGGGPAGLLSALVLAGRGVRVSVCDPRLHRPTERPQSHHVHLLAAATWQTLCELAPGLDGEVARLHAPCGYGDADTLDASGQGPQRWFPDRWMIDAGLEALCMRRAEIDFNPLAAGSVWRTRGGWQTSASGSREFDWLVDCSGTVRESLRMLDAGKQPEVLESGIGGSHASIRVTGVGWPTGIVGHTARDAYGLGGFLLRRCSRSETLITWQLPGSAAMPESADALLDALRRCPDHRMASLVRRGLPAGPVHRWRSRRMSVLGIPRVLPDRWLALGDALLTTPPRLGRGLAQLAGQLETLAHGLAAGQSSRHILERLVDDARERFYGASMAQLLWEACPAENPAKATAEILG